MKDEDGFSMLLLQVFNWFNSSVSYFDCNRQEAHEIIQSSQLTFSCSKSKQKH